MPTDIHFDQTQSNNLRYQNIDSVSRFERAGSKLDRWAPEIGTQARLRALFEGSSEKIWPSRICTTRCAYSAMSNSCVTSTMVFPCECRWSKSAMISIPVFESRLPVGS